MLKNLVVAAFALSLGLAGCGHAELGVSDLKSDQTEAPFWPTAKPGDDQLNTAHALYRYFSASRAKQLPANYFRELIGANSDVVVKYADWPRYQPGWFSGGTIYHPAFNKPLETWGSSDWSTFYNELFHAWWGNVFMKASKYATIRGQLLTAERDAHYRRE
jgi:hypothetical protein